MTGDANSSTTVASNTTPRIVSPCSGSRWDAINAIPSATPAWGSNASPIQRLTFFS